METKAQTPLIGNDTELIAAKAEAHIEMASRKRNPKRTFLIRKADPLTVKLNPVNYVFGGLLFFYQTSLSRQFSADCLYEPTCSSFSKDVISNYGPAKGLLLTADRLCRCNRVAQSDIHPLTINEQTYRSVDGHETYQTIRQKNKTHCCDEH
ncbi:membrane protein insertion efficiency factor YidD [Alkaliflexus imshenetskii]|uniref:membrane protein insertion efficiency factor YidD n=1 Tax=Alkaliflexus imshenetskii TaxID=286730 RepID=UPI0004B93AC2|nr:membrane protein insertion efficiency factor YidD [Alkaliflexus imshenetskii]